MAAKQHKSIAQMRKNAQDEFDVKLNKDIVDKLAEHYPELLDELAAAVGEDMQNPKPKRTRTAKKTEPATPDVSSQPTTSSVDGAQSQQHEDSVREAF